MTDGLDAEQLTQRFQAVKDVLYEDLRELIAQPSVSARNEGVEECAGLVSEMMRRDGFDVERHPTKGGRPILLAKLGDPSRQTTILLYNHYDVQPPEPLDEWRSPPFELVERGGLLYGRGVSDNKADLAARLAAVRLLRDALGEMPLAVRWVVEGEEEVGSISLAEFVESKGAELKADGCLWESGDIGEAGVPNFYLGVKGMLYVEISARTAEGDRHSMYAPIIPNAAWSLLRLLNSLKSLDERVLIKGFYDDVRRPSRSELALLRGLRFSGKEMRLSLGVKRLLPGADSLLLRRLVMAPTCNIAGLVSGYTGSGGKTIVPATASAKLDFRLVPDQRPEKILALLKRHAKRFGDFEIQVHSQAYPARSDPDSPLVRSSTEAAEDCYGLRPQVWPSMFGTGPMALVTRLGIPAGMLNCIAHTGSNLHAPNENIFADHLHRGVVHLALTFNNFARRGRGPA